jgi:alanine racemase
MKVDYPTKIEISIDALFHNLKTIKRIVGDMEIMAVVKADAYGHGAARISRELEKLGISFLGVANVREGIKLREAGIEGSIVILGGFFPEEIPEILKYNLTPTLIDFPRSEDLEQVAAAENVSVKAHIRIDTGTGTIGIPYQEAKSILRRISQFQHLTIEGIYSDFAIPEQSSQDFSQIQLNRFKKILNELKKIWISVPYKHIANSGAILHLPHNSVFNMIRPGLSLYGIDPLSRESELIPILSFKTKVVQVKVVPAKVSLGYGRHYITKRKSLIATLPVGYADGIIRFLSNKGKVLIKGHYAPIIGMVAMDLCLVDVTEVPGVEVGDEVVIIGKQNGAEITVHDVAAQIGTVPYEILCGLGKRVPKIYIKGGEIVGICQ